MTGYPLVPLKRFARIVGGSTPPGDERYWGGSVTWYTPTDVAPVHGGTLSESVRTLTEAGLAACSASVAPAESIVVTTRAPVGNLAITDRPAATNQGCKAVVPVDGNDERFIAYALRAFGDVLRSTATGTTFQEVSAEHLARLRVPCPHGDHQSLVADFLDRESERIRNLGRLIGQAETVASRYGASLFDELTARASKVRLRHGLRAIQQGWSPQCENRPAEQDEWGVLKLGCLNGGEFNWREHKALQADHAPRPGLEVGQGDLLISRANTRALVGNCALVRETRPRLLLSDLLYRLVLDAKRWKNDFVALALNAPSGRFQIERAALGSAGSMPKITHAVIKELQLPDMRIDGQTAVVREVHRKRRTTDLVRNRVQRLSHRLSEYRDALITEAVSGKVDVTRLSESQLDESAHAALEGERPEVLSA